MLTIINIEHGTISKVKITHSDIQYIDINDNYSNIYCNTSENLDTFDTAP